MGATIRIWRQANFSQFSTLNNKGMPGDEIRLASLFFDTASRTRKRKRNRRSEYPKTLWYAMAEVNTLKRPCARLLPDNWQTRTQYWVPWTGCALRVTAITLFYALIKCICWCPVSQAMPVWPIAQCSVCMLPPHHLSWISFGCYHPYWASYYPLPISASIGIAAFTPLVCSFIVSFRLVSWFQHGSYLGTHHACSPAHWQKATGSFSYIPIRHLCWCAW